MIGVVEVCVSISHEGIFKLKTTLMLADFTQHCHQLLTGFFFKSLAYNHCKQFLITCIDSLWGGLPMQEGCVPLQVPSY